jgi:hypothetical protein
MLVLGQVCFLPKPFCIISRVTLEALYSLSLIFILANSLKKDETYINHSVQDFEQVVCTMRWAGHVACLGEERGGV